MKPETKPAVNGKAIRARIGTSLAVTEGHLVLTCTGNDPGLTFDLSTLKSPGPYTLAFRLQSRASGDGDVYWISDVQTTLPKGRHLTFHVNHDGQWHDVAITIPETQTMHAIRLDSCAGPGEVRIEELRLEDANGTTLKSWP